MTSHSNRLRVSVTNDDLLRLRWLADVAGNEAPREASLLLAVGIRVACRRWRELLARAKDEARNYSTASVNWDAVDRALQTLKPTDDSDLSDTSPTPYDQPPLFPIDERPGQLPD